jgi:carboxypeptidase PM20D1
MIKKLVVIAGVVLIILVGVLGVKTASFSSKQVAVDPIDPIAIDEDEAAERLAAAIRFKTVSHMDPAEDDPEPFRQLHAFLATTFPRVHQAMSLEKVNELSLLYRWDGTDTALDPVILCAHQDVVPVAPGTDDAWNFDAYAGEIDEGFVWGRGALDDKVNIMSLFEAAERLLEEGYQPKRTVYFAFGHDEEVGGKNGAQAIAALLKERGIHAELVLDEGGAVVEGALPGLDRPMATLGIAEKGYMSVELKVEAEGGHSSQPPKETAIGILSHAVYNVEAHPLPGGLAGSARVLLEHVGPEMGLTMRILLANLWITSPLVESQLGGSPLMNAFMRTTTAPTIFEAGVKDNVLPAHARAVINFRIIPGDTTESVLEHVRRVVNDERVSIAPLEWASDPSAVSPAEGWAYETLETTVREIIPEAVVSPFLVLAGTDARHYELVAENIYRFAPFQIESSELKGIHGINERIAVPAYANMIRFYHRLLEHL